MKTKLSMTIIVLMCTFWFVSAAGAGNVVKAGTVNWPPYYGESLKNGGFMTEITREAFKRSGWDYELEYMNWNRAEGLCKQGKLDMVQGGFYTDERSKIYRLTDQYATVSIVFFKKKGNELSYSTIDELAGKKVGLIRGWIYPDAISKSTSLKLDYVDKPLSNIKKLLVGRVDVIVGSKAVIIDTVNREMPDQAGMLVPMDPPIKANPVHNIISSKIADSKAIAEAFNNGLKEIREDGTYDEINKKHGF